MCESCLQNGWDLLVVICNKDVNPQQGIEGQKKFIT